MWFQRFHAWKDSGLKIEQKSWSSMVVLILPLPLCSFFLLHYSVQFSLNGEKIWDGERRLVGDTDLSSGGLFQAPESFSYIKDCGRQTKRAIFVCPDEWIGGRISYIIAIRVLSIIASSCFETIFPPLSDFSDVLRSASQHIFIRSWYHLIYTLSLCMGIPTEELHCIKEAKRH